MLLDRVYRGLSGFERGLIRVEFGWMRFDRVLHGVIWFARVCIEEFDRA